MTEKKDFVNPIDKDKITDSPSTLPYAHSVGGAVIKPEDVGKIKGRALSSMYEQTQTQLDQIREQIDLLAQQAKRITDRIKLSSMIYEAKIPFEPLVGHIYHLYEKDDGSWFVSMVSNEEWGRKRSFVYIATVKLLSDHTWEILEQSEAYTISMDA